MVEKEGCRMAFSPSDSPVYGGGNIVVAFSPATILPSDAQLYLIYEGTKQRHVTTARLINQHTVQAAIPGHNEAEDVVLTLLMCHHGNRQVLASSTFFFICDTAYYMAHFLRDSVFDPSALEILELIKSEKFDLSHEELSTLDDRLSHAFGHLHIPEGWHILGLDSTVPVPPPRESLLHFAARLGLRKLATVLMEQPGSEDALRLPNRHGELPVDIARELGLEELARSLTEYHQSGVGSWDRGDKVQVTDGTVVTRHGRGMTTLTADLHNTTRSLKDDLEMLREFTTLVQDEPDTSHYAVDPGIRRPRSKSDAPQYSQQQYNRYSANYDAYRPRTSSDGLALIEQENENEEEDIFSYDSFSEQQQSQQLFYMHHGHQGNRRDSHNRRYVKNQHYNPSKGKHRRGFHGERPYSAPAKQNIPNISISSLGPKGPILEENLRRLHEISEGIIRLRELNDTHLQVQDGRKDNLQRFSTSCPSLNEPEVSPSNVPNNVSADYYHSMMNLKQELSAVTPGDENITTMDYPETDHTEIQIVEPDVRICINDVTLDSTDDFISQPDGTSHYDLEKNALIEHYKKHPRRRSWCPEKTNTEKKEFRNKMLSVSNRSDTEQVKEDNIYCSLSLSSLDGQDDEDDSDEEDNEDIEDNGELQSPSQSQSSIAEGISQTDISHGSLNGSLNTSDLPDSMFPTANSTPTDSSSRLTAPRTGGTFSSSGTSSVRSMTDVRLALSDSGDAEVADTSHGMAPYGGGHDSDISNSSSSLVLAGHPTLMKSVSTPSIPSLKEDDKARADERRPGTISEVGSETNNATQKKEELDEDEVLNALLQGERRSARSGRMSMIEFLNDPTNFKNDEDKPKQEVKEEKKRRSSVFSKFGSYRQKKLREKEQKSRSTHQFVSVSFSNSTACTVCKRSMANKPALQCERCLVNVHESSCKDQIIPCANYRHHKLPQRTPSAPSQEAREKMTRFQSNSLPASDSVKSSQSFREGKRALSVPSRSTQHSLSTGALLPKNQSHRASSPSKVISEEKEREHEVEPVNQVSNISDTLSVSMESLDEGTTEVRDFEDDPVLRIKQKEAEAWSLTVDKKTLKKLAAKDIKRQDHIWEFILTEKSHCRTLKIMQKIFRQGMSHELHMPQEVLDRIFPCLDDLLDIHLTFLQNLRELQQLRADKSIDDIGATLCQQFEGEMGNRMKQAYGHFCSRHNKAVEYYKEILKTERKFQNFVKKCSLNENCKKQDIPACILLVTQRMTKYPLLIEPIIKTTKARNLKERGIELKNLQHALELSKSILAYVDDQIDATEKEERLQYIYSRFDPRSVAYHRNRKFKKSDLLNRKLLHEGTVHMKSARGKSSEVTAVLLSDLIFFMHESNQKYVFFSQDNKSSVISLSKLLVREKGDTRDSRGIYLICQSKSSPEMYEIVCRSLEDRKQWISIIRRSITKCPEEADEGVTSENEEEKKLIEAYSAKIRQLIDVLHQKDTEIHNSCEDKMKAIVEMLEVFGREEIMNNIKSIYKDKEKTELRDPEDLLQAALQEASRLTMMLQSSGSNLSRSVSSAGEHESATYVIPPLPKRAETFGGFEGKEYPKGYVKKRYPSGLDDSDSRSNSLQHLDGESDSELVMLSVDASSKLLTHRRGSTGQPGNTETTKASTKERINRRMSTSFLQNLLMKQHTEKEELDSRLSDRSSDRGSLGELSSASSSTSNQHPFGPHTTKEQCASIVQLVQYLHGLVYISTQQTTQVESLKAQLSEASYKLSKAGSDSEQRKGTYHHDKQLEELRNLQETINKERETWERERKKKKVPTATLR